MASYQQRLSSLQTVLETFFARDPEECSADQERFVTIMQSICTVVRDTERAGLDIDQRAKIANAADILLELGIQLATGGAEPDMVLFESIPSFAHSADDSAPLVKESHQRFGKLAWFTHGN